MTSDYPKAKRFLESLEKYNWPISAVVQDNFISWQNKFIVCYERMRELRNTEYTHAIHLDAWDVVAVQGKSKFERALYSLGNPALILAAETNVYPTKELEPRYPKIESPFKFVNSQYCVRLDWDRFDELANITVWNDQDHMALFYLDNLNNPDVVLDSNCELFQCLFQTKPELFDADHRNKLTNTYPIFFHGNGKVNMDWIKE